MCCQVSLGTLKGANEYDLLSLDYLLLVTFITTSYKTLSIAFRCKIANARFLIVTMCHI